ncbi:MAG TPA: hypothetical protein VM450_07400 [Thermomicrobiales bacterium]|jgi:5-methylcytosine-specific restriction protein A|nr:hypothetical protein [Thermomicrobiales bacterium]
MARNPAWTCEEIILATELYVDVEGKWLGPRHPKAIELSKVLNKLPIHAKERRAERFRSPESVGLKLVNIRAVDPSRQGGQPHGSRLDGLFWDKFGGDATELRKAASLIRRKYGI